ncbi:PrsW family glutamic-type intramembrane protease [Lentisphaerota bacterium WC36G]|nr:PrsW family intramembrane metalloprotease [Lentisphaerae bacterium WC36]
MKSKLFSVANETVFQPVDDKFDCDNKFKNIKFEDNYSNFDKEIILSIKSEIALKNNLTSEYKVLNEFSENILLSKSYLLVIIVALIGGLLSIPITFILSFTNATNNFLTGILGTPLIEELAKAIGCIYILEKHPYWIKNSAQIIFCCVFGALIFSVGENLLYINVYLNDLSSDVLLKVAHFRWRYCTLLHLSCSFIVSLGMLKVYHGIKSSNKIFVLKEGKFYFILAIVIHISYNLLASIFENKLFY